MLQVLVRSLFHGKADLKTLEQVTTGEPLAARKVEEAHHSLIASQWQEAPFSSGKPITNSGSPLQNELLESTVGTPQNDKSKQFLSTSTPVLPNMKTSYRSQAGSLFTAVSTSTNCCNDTEEKPRDDNRSPQVYENGMICAKKDRLSQRGRSGVLNSQKLSRHRQQDESFSSSSCSFIEGNVIDLLCSPVKKPREIKKREDILKPFLENCNDTKDESETNVNVSCNKGSPSCLSSTSNISTAMQAISCHAPFDIIDGKCTFVSSLKQPALALSSSSTNSAVVDNRESADRKRTLNEDTTSVEFAEEDKSASCVLKSQASAAVSLKAKTRVSRLSESGSQKLQMLMNKQSTSVKFTYPALEKETKKFGNLSCIENINDSMNFSRYIEKQKSRLSATDKEIRPNDPRANEYFSPSKKSFEEMTLRTDPKRALPAVSKNLDERPKPHFISLQSQDYKVCSLKIVNECSNTSSPNLCNELYSSSVQKQSKTAEMISAWEDESFSPEFEKYMMNMSTQNLKCSKDKIQDTECIKSASTAESSEVTASMGRIPSPNQSSCKAAKRKSQESACSQPSKVIKGDCSMLNVEMSSGKVCGGIDASDSNEAPGNRLSLEECASLPNESRKSGGNLSSFTFKVENLLFADALNPNCQKSLGGFSTAAGSKVSVSELSLAKAKALWNQCGDVSEIQENESKIDNTEIDSLKTGKSTSDSINADVSACENKFSGFNTANGKSVSISREALVKAKRMWQESSTITDGDSDISTYAKKSDVTSNKTINFCNSNFETAKLSTDKAVHAIAAKSAGVSAKIVTNASSGFFTANGRSVSVSNETLKAAERLWKESGESEKETANTTSLFLDSANAMQNCKFSGFSTANGKSVQVSTEALKQAAAILKNNTDDDISEEGFSVSKDITTSKKSDKETVTPAVAFLSKSQRKTPVRGFIKHNINPKKITGESSYLPEPSSYDTPKLNTLRKRFYPPNSKLKNIPSSSISSTTDRNSKPPIDTLTANKRLTLEEQQMLDAQLENIAQEFLEDGDEWGIEEQGIKTFIGTSGETVSKRALKPTNNTVPDSSPGEFKNETDSQNAEANNLKDCMSGSSNVQNINNCLYSATSKESTETLVSFATLNDESFGGFSTAGGNKVFISKSALEKAKTVLNKSVDYIVESQADPKKNDSMLSANDLTTVSGKSFGGFCTAGGNKVSVSKKALEKAKALWHRCEDEDHESLIEKTDFRMLNGNRAKQLTTSLTEVCVIYSGILI